MAESEPCTPEQWLPRFGLTAFRAGQREVIQAVLAGRDCLCIMPTGGGKSLCYQLPAIMRPGVVLVVSPLIALMKDQVDGLHALGLRATFINSSLEPFEQQQRLEGMAAGKFDLVYIAPERLRSPRFLESVKSITVQLLAIDEAHCISQWGHDFRPDYARIGRFREKLGFPQTIALTATATPLVRRDVLDQLQLKSPDVFVTGFARPNLRFEVHEPGSTREKDDQLLAVLNQTPGPALIYASTRKKCEAIVEFLAERRTHPVGFYHAGLLPDERRSIQDRFMSGQLPLIVATNAFGMGIDKRDLRLVVHYNMPGSLEAYYQEAGRAGRDGLPSRCVLLFSFSDRYIQEFFIDNAFPSRDAVRRVYEFLRNQPGDPIELTQQEIKDALSLPLSGEGVGVCEQLLEKCGVLERLDSRQNLAQVKLDSELPTLVDLLPREARMQRRVLRELERIVDDRRSEWVSFHPQKLAATLDMDRDALYRAMRELTRLSAFDYVPPFRGRAVHMLQRDAKFDSLPIDFQELERRKAEELQRLERVITYAQTHRCRQREILNYFGDAQRLQCGVCDNCRPHYTAEPVAPVAPAAPAVSNRDESVREAVRMVLSGVARARGKIGKTLLARMLCGSRSTQIAQLQLDRLSTFGLLQDLTQADVVELIQALIRGRLLQQSKPQPRRPVVQLTDLGQAVMRGQQELPPELAIPPQVLVQLQRRRTSSVPATTTPGRATEARATSSTESAPTAESRAGEPGEPLAVPLPASVAESGFGQEPEQPARVPARATPAATVPQAGKVVPIEAPSQQPPTAADGAAALDDRTRDAPHRKKQPADQEALPRPNCYWTWRLLQDGYALAECMAIRGVDEETILDHLVRASQAGWPVDLSWVLSPEQQEVLEQVVGKSSPVRLYPLIRHLPEGLGLSHVQLFGQIRAAAGTNVVPG